jgi:hypothetical protein
LHGEVDDHPHLAASQLVASEAAVRLATAATVAIAMSLADRLPMLLEGFQN